MTGVTNSRDLQIVLFLQSLRCRSRSRADRLADATFGSDSAAFGSSAAADLTDSVTHERPFGERDSSRGQLAVGTKRKRPASVSGGRPRKSDRRIDSSGYF